jgi:mono/diheme cytochrome c family protein
MEDLMHRTLVTKGWLFVFALISSAGLATAQDAEVVKKGQAVYAAQKCSMCHAIAGKGEKTSPLDGVGAKLSTDDIRAWIVTPKQMEQKTKSTKKPPMPDKYSKLPAADLDALVAYMASLK